MTSEFAIKVLTELRGYGDKFANIGSDRKEALDMAIKALKQTDKIEESNFSTEQYKADLQGSYDCGYNCGYADGFAECLDLNT